MHRSEWGETFENIHKYHVSTLIFVFVLMVFESAYHIYFHKIKKEKINFDLCNADMPVIENEDVCSSEKKCNKKDCLTGCAATFREAMEEVCELVLAC